MGAARATSKKPNGNPLSAYGQIVLVLQGGGALGAYQAGVYQALHEGGIEPDWVIGTSIGAINASLIAGNKPAERLARLREFWSRVEHKPFLQLAGSWPIIGQAAATFFSTVTGIDGFFEPNLQARFGPHVKLDPEAAGYYSTAPLQRTLTDLVDFDQIKIGPTRLTVGAANVHTSAMTYFDSRDITVDVKHVMASGALPPAFPAVRIDGSACLEPKDRSVVQAADGVSALAVTHLRKLGGPASPDTGPLFFAPLDLVICGRWGMPSGAANGTGRGIPRTSERVLGRGGENGLAVFADDLHRDGGTLGGVSPATCRPTRSGSYRGHPQQRES